MNKIVTPAKRVASYTKMEDGTAEDYQFVIASTRQFAKGLPERLVGFLDLLKNSYEGEQIDRYQHSLQTGSRALRDGADDETVVAALLHDIGDILAIDNHAEFAAAILRPFVRDDTYWMIQHHHTFQGYFYYHHIGLDRNEREKFRGHPSFEKTVEFCDKWDQTSFDPSYDTLPIEAFLPTIRTVFSREPWSAKRL